MRYKINDVVKFRTIDDDIVVGRITDMTATKRCTILEIKSGDKTYNIGSDNPDIIQNITEDIGRETNETYGHKEHYKNLIRAHFWQKEQIESLDALVKELAEENKLLKHKLNQIADLVDCANKYDFKENMFQVYKFLSHTSNTILKGDNNE